MLRTTSPRYSRDMSTSGVEWSSHSWEDWHCDSESVTFNSIARRSLVRRKTSASPHISCLTRCCERQGFLFVILHERLYGPSFLSSPLAGRVMVTDVSPCDSLILV